ncbi:MAG: hypothetical protein IJI73_09455 [Kiritimatiellae bacterium]|nr:hypothetical protein [Kiritimatiellia bacterium]
MKGNGAGRQSARRRTGASTLSRDLPAGDLLAACRLHDPLAVAVVHDLAAAVAGDLRRVAFDVSARLVRRTEVIRRFFNEEYDAATTAAIAAELDSPRDDTPRDLVKSDVPGGVSVRGKESRNLDS